MGSLAAPACAGPPSGAVFAGNADGSGVSGPAPLEPSALCSVRGAMPVDGPDDVAVGREFDAVGDPVPHPARRATINATSGVTRRYVMGNVVPGRRLAGPE